MNIDFKGTLKGERKLFGDKNDGKGWREIVQKVVVLQTAELGLISNIQYGPLNTSRNYF